MFNDGMVVLVLHSSCKVASILKLEAKCGKKILLLKIKAFSKSREKSVIKWSSNNKNPVHTWIMTLSLDGSSSFFSGFTL